jgi:hypothetical protein
LACASTFAYGQGHNLGLGIILGEPTGISVKYWLGSTNAVSGAAAWSFSDEAAMHIHADYLFHNFGLIQQNLPLYYGIGAKVKFADDVNVGIRIPVGIAYIFDAPVDTFLEIVPLLELVPDTEFGLNAAIGVRYYF